MLIMKLKFQVERGQRERFLETIRGLLERIRVEDGCVECQLVEDIKATGSLCMVEIWRDEQVLSQHLRAKSFQRLLVAMDLLKEPPEVSLSEISNGVSFQSLEELFSTIKPDAIE